MPMILGECGHTICLHDLQQLAHQAEAAGLPPRCPSCKARFHYRPHTQHHAEQGEAGCGVSRNFALLQLLENAHRLMGGVPLQAIPRCSTHPLGVLEMFCKDCGVGVCPKCFLERHRGHSMAGLEEAFLGQGQRDVADALAVGERALQQARTQRDAVRDRRARLLAMHEGAKREIVRHFDVVIAAAQRRRAQLLLAVERAWLEEVDAPCEAEEAAAAGREADVGKRLEELRELRSKGLLLALMDATPPARRFFEQASLPAIPAPSASVFLPSALAVRWGDWPVDRLVEQAISTCGTLEVQRPLCCEEGSEGALREAAMEGGVLGLTAGYATARGSGLQGAVLGQTTTFVLTAYGADGRRRWRGGEDDFVVVIVEEEEERHGGDHGAMAAGAVVLPTVRDRRDGTYEICYTPALRECFDEESVSGCLSLIPHASVEAGMELARHCPIITAAGAGAGAGGLLRLGAASSSPPRYLKITISGHRRPTRQRRVTQPEEGGDDDGEVAPLMLPALSTPGRRPWHRVKTEEEAIEEDDALLGGVETGGPLAIVGGPTFHVRVHPPFLGVHMGSLGAKGAGPGCFDGPGSLCVDGDLLWVADGDNHRVQVLDLSHGGAVVAVYGGSGSSSSFRSPYGICVDETFAYVAERDAGRVSVLEKHTGKLVRVLGQKAGMRDPLAVGVDGRLVGVTDSSNSRVVFMDKRTGQVVHVLGPSLPPEAGGGTLACPCDVVFDEMEEGSVVYVSDREASRILVFDMRTWAFKRQIGSHGVGLGEFTHVNRLCIAHDRVYASDRFGRRVMAFNKHTGDALLALGEKGLLDRPNGMAVYGSQVLCADFTQSRVHMFG